MFRSQNCDGIGFSVVMDVHVIVYVIVYVTTEQEHILELGLLAAYLADDEILLEIKCIKKAVDRPVILVECVIPHPPSAAPHSRISPEKLTP